MTVPQLHQQLTTDHFPNGHVPELRKLRDHLAGEGLTWALVEAVADLCFPHEAGQQALERLEQPKALWEAAHVAPTPLGVHGEPSVPAHELLQAQRRTIEVYDELDRARRAFEASEQGRQQALQMATLLFAMLGQAQAKVAELSRRLDVLQLAEGVPDAELAGARAAVQRAGGQEQGLRRQLARAEKDRNTAQTVADHAARRIETLEAELRRLKARTDSAASASADASVSLPTPLASVQPARSTALDAVDETLDKVRGVLDREQASVREAAEDLGLDVSSAESSSGLSSTVVRGQVVPRDQDASASTSIGAEAQVQPQLSGTTANNPGPSPSGPRPPAPNQTQAVDHASFVATATERIASSMSLDEVLSGLGESTVPDFADTLLIYLRDPLHAHDGLQPLTLKFSHRHPEPGPSDALSQTFLNTGSNETASVSPDTALHVVLNNHRPILATSPLAHAAVNELLGVVPGPGTSAILAPLWGKRQLMGIAVFLRRAQRGIYEEADVLAASQAAKHTALGLDRALLYRSQANYADLLQRTMLPPSLPQPTGVHLAFRYLPATETARVGGDWYDAIPLPANRIALMVGDVMGRSMASAAIMGQLRTTAQTLAGLDLPPQEVLHHLDEQAQRLGSDRMATCLYAVYDPVAHRIIVANAGHPPPVMLHQDGRADVLRVPPGAPIGVGGVDFEAVELDAPAGATLVLYTDGLVESRIRDVWTGIEQLRERLAETARLTGPNPPPLEPLCDEILLNLGSGDRDDDVALLAARCDGIAPSNVAYWYLDPKAESVGQARHLTRRALERWGLEELTHQVELLISEVVTNAVRYAERPITLRLLRTEVLRCEVGDDVPQLPRLRQAKPLDDDGRGLYLVNRLARRWGATRLSSGKVVWFEVSYPGP